MEDLGDVAGDSSFLNDLTKDVSRWIREIHKVRQRQYVPGTCIDSFDSHAGACVGRGGGGGGVCM